MNVAVLRKILKTLGWILPFILFALVAQAIALFFNDHRLLSQAFKVAFENRNLLIIQLVLAFFVIRAEDPSNGNLAYWTKPIDRRSLLNTKALFFVTLF